MQQTLHGAQGAMAGLESGVDAGMRNIVADIMAPVAKTQQLEDKLRSLGNQVRTSKSVSEIVRLKKEISATQRELDGVNPGAMEQKVGGAASRMRSMFGGLVAPLAGAFAVGGITAFGKGLLDAASNAQMYESSLGVILKDKGKVDSLMAQVKTFAAETPFSLLEIQEASKSFSAAGFGIDEIIPKLRTIGQTAAALGQPFDEIADFYRKVKSNGKIEAEDLNQLGGRGIPIITKLAEVMGVAEDQVRKLTSEGKVGFKEMEAAFERMGGVGGDFDGIFGAAMGSLTGKVSTLGDAWDTFKVNLGTALAPTFSDGIALASDALAGLQTGFDWVIANGDTIKDVLAGVGIAVGIYTTALLINNASLIANNALQAVAAVRMGILGGVMNIVSAATTVWTGVQWLLNAALTANPIGLVIAGIAALVGAVVYAWNNFAEFRAFLYSLWSAFKETFGGIYDVVSGIFDKLVNVFKSAAAVFSAVFSNPLEAGYLDGIKSAVGGYISDIGSLVSQVADVPDQLAGVAKNAAIAGAEGWKEGLADFEKDALASAEKDKAGSAAGATATPGLNANSFAPVGQDVGAASLVDGAAQPKDPKAKGDGVTVGGSAGSGRTITMDIQITNNITMPKDGNMGVRELADKISGALTNKFNDAQFAAG
jgi:tape measure domain-containing protein